MRKLVVIAEERYYRLCYIRNKSVRLAYSSWFHGAGAEGEREAHELEQGHLTGMGLNLSRTPSRATGDQEQRTKERKSARASRSSSHLEAHVPPASVSSPFASSSPPAPGNLSPALCPCGNALIHFTKVEVHNTWPFVCSFFRALYFQGASVLEPLWVNSCLFVAEWHPTVCLDRILFFHSSFDAHHFCVDP